MDFIATAKLISIPTAFLLSGYMTSASQNSVPLLYNQPASVSTRIFDGVYHRGAALVIPGSIISAAASAYLAYVLPSQRTLHVANAALTVGVLPFTAAVMMKGIHRLMDVSKDATEQEKAGQSGEVLRLLKAWDAQNAVRAAMCFAGGIAGLWAVMTA